MIVAEVERHSLAQQLRTRLSAARTRLAARELLELGLLRTVAEAWAFHRSHGVSALRYPLARRAHLDLVPPWVDLRRGVLIDIGANEGNWTSAALGVVPDAMVIAIEPSPAPRKVLAARFADRGNVIVDARAVTDVVGRATLHVTRASVFGSLLPPLESLQHMYSLPGAPTDVVDHLEVSTVTLDELVGEQHVAVLKLDVQGAELSVLRGGRRALSQTDAVIMEVLFVPHYEGDATFAALDQEMRELGFELVDIAKPLRLSGGPALWADACYARRR
ncbi:MAG: FkbM family methyltransferase [Acidimicrobiales bacterium]